MEQALLELAKGYAGQGTEYGQDVAAWLRWLAEGRQGSEVLSIPLDQRIAGLGRLARTPGHRPATLGTIEAARIAQRLMASRCWA